eukprot:scaffold2261_cov405-Prasinococcus_capsulatus_cf.AAC.33
MGLRDRRRQLPVLVYNDHRPGSERPQRGFSLHSPLSGQARRLPCPRSESPQVRLASQSGTCCRKGTAAWPATVVENRRGSAYTKPRRQL